MYRLLINGKVKFTGTKQDVEKKFYALQTNLITNGIWFEVLSEGDAFKFETPIGTIVVAIDNEEWLEREKSELEYLINVGLAKPIKKYKLVEA